MPKNTRTLVVASSEWTIPAEDGVHRRTIVKGAAWTIPVVAVAVATPAAAASKTPTLAFTQASYSGTACGTITGTQVKRTTDGTAPDAGKTVTVTLKDGYTFANGSTTYSGTTDANGLITLPDIKVPAKGGNSTFGATSDTLTTSAPVTAPVAGTARDWTDLNSSTNTSTKVPAGAKTLGFRTYLTQSGDLYLGDTLIASGVTSASGQIDRDGYVRVTYVDASGGHTKSNQTGTTYNADYANVPTDATAIGFGAFLTPGGDLWDGNTKVKSGVTSAVSEIDRDGYLRVTYVDATGAHTYSNNTAAGYNSSYTSVPKGATAVGFAAFLTSGGDLWVGNTKVSTGVTSAVSEIDRDGYIRTTYMDATGAHTYSNNTATGYNTNLTSVPKGATAVGYATFLTSGGDLYEQNKVIASGVTSASSQIDKSGNVRVSYVNAECK